MKFENILWNELKLIIICMLILSDAAVKYREFLQVGRRLLSNFVNKTSLSDVVYCLVIFLHFFIYLPMHLITKTKPKSKIV